MFMILDFKLDFKKLSDRIYLYSIVLLMFLAVEIGWWTIGANFHNNTGEIIKTSTYILGMIFLIPYIIMVITTEVKYRKK